MSVTYDENTKTLTITYVNDTKIQKNTKFSEKDVNIINVEGSFTATSYMCFCSYFPVYEINLPDSIQYIDNSVIEGSKVTSFHIPFNLKTLSQGQPFDWCETIEKFTIDSNHPNFAVVDDVLFSKDMKTIYSFPNAKKCKVYQVPFGVESIVHGCFAKPKYLTHIVLPSSIKLACNLFYYSSLENKNVTIIKCPCDDPNATIQWKVTSQNVFAPKNAIIKAAKYNETLSSDGKTLIVSPMTSCGEVFNAIEFDDTAFSFDKNIETVIFETGIERISKESFRGCSKLKHISFSNTIKSINDDAFRGCKLGFNSIIYSSDSLSMLLHHFSRYSLGILSYSCNNKQRHASFLLMIIPLIYR